MNYDLCSTLAQIEDRIGGGAGAPVFVYTQPQNLHISVIQRDQERVVQPGRYDGFYPPYASRLARIDGCFGNFVQFLKNRQLYDNSIVIVTADHGDSLGEGGRWGHAYTIFPEVLEIPLLIHLPSAMAKEVTLDARPVALLSDLAPTLYYLLGQRPVAVNPVFGRPLFTGREEERRAYQRDAYPVASSYGPVYGILSAGGRRLYIADAVGHREYSFNLAGAPAPVPVTVSERREQRQRITDFINGINKFYGYRGGGARLP
jgi:arylsulfatase A-like enzyme